MRRSLVHRVTVSTILVLSVLLLTALAGSALLRTSQRTIADLTSAMLQHVLLNNRVDTALDHALLEAATYAYAAGRGGEEQVLRHLDDARAAEEALFAIEQDRESEPLVQRAYAELHRRRNVAFDEIERELDLFLRARAAGDAPTAQRQAERLDALHEEFLRLEQDAVVVFQQDVAGAQARLNQLVARGYALCLGGVSLLALLVGGNALRIRRNIATPINRLSVAAGAVAAGRFDQEVAVTQRGEIGDLQRAFNQMIAELRARHSSLAQRNGELQRAHDELVTARAALIVGEEQLRQANVELEERVAERTAALTAANQKLEERELQYRSVVDSIEEVIFQTDADGRWTFLNPAWAHITDFTLEESLGALFLDFVHPDDRQRNQELFQPLVERKKEYCRHEVRYLTKDGNFRWVEVHARLTLGADGSILGTSGTLTDLTMRKLSEQVLRESEERFRQIAEHVQEVFFITTPRIDQVFYASPAYETIWERSCSSLYESPRSWLETVHPLDQPGVCLGIQTLDNPLGVLQEFRILRPSGETRWIRLRAVPILNDQGVAYRLVGTAEDITERRHAQETLHYHTEFERLVTTISTHFINRGVAEVDTGIQNALALIGQFADLDRTYVCLFSDDLSESSTTHEWCAPEVRSQMHHLQHVSTASFPWLIERLRRLESVHLPPVSALAGGVRRPEFTAPGACSALIIPIVSGGVLIGCFGCDLLRFEKAWPDESIALFKMVSEIFAGALQRKWAEQALWEANETLERRVLKRTQALQESEGRYRTLVERMSEGLTLVDEQGSIQFVNDRLCELTGYLRDELLGQPVYGFLLPAAAQVSLSKQPPRGGRVGADQYEVRIRCKSSEQIWVQVGHAPLVDLAGEVRGAILVYTDITERKGVEAALAEERSLLAQRVAERTADLSRANAELARVARLKDEFLASMSHELRTPLNTILGMTESLQEGIYGPLAPEQAESLGHIDESGRHLLTLINDILDLSKIEAGKLSLDLEEVDIRSVCEASLRMIRQSARQKRLRLSSQIDPHISAFLSEARRLKQILVNLLSNAVKFTPEGGALGLEVAADEEEEVVRFAVWDSGIGIAPADLGRLFQPFVQLDSGLARQYSGTGLGLALVQRMTELHGGSVIVESTVGKGSRFTVSLPYKRPQPDGAGGAGDQEAPLLLNGADRPAPTGAAEDVAGRAVILLAEDHPMNIITFSGYLTAKGYRVIVARNGAEALNQAWENRPDLILMDIQMPVMDGIEATRRIKAQPELAETPIIALTGLSMPGDRERCLAAGADDYMSKPVSLKRLIGRVAALLA